MIKNNILVYSIKKSLSLLPDSFRVRSILLLISIITNSFFDLIGLASILPLLASVLDPEFLTKTPFLLHLFNFLGFEEKKWFVVFLCSLTILILLLKNLFSFWVQKMEIKFTWDAYVHLSSDILLSAYQKGFLYFKNENSNDIEYNITGIPTQFAQSFLYRLFTLLNEAVIFIFIIVSLLAYDYKILIFLTLIITPIFVLFYRKNRTKVATLNKRLGNIIPKISKPVLETTFGFTDVSITNTFKYFKKQYLSFVEESKDIHIKLGIVSFLPTKLLEMSVILAIILIILYSVFFIKNTSETITLVTVLGLAAFRSIPSINRLMYSAVSIKGQLYIFEIIDSFLPLKKRVKQTAITFQKTITIKNLSYTFDDAITPVLENFNLEINKGEIIGIKGPSGKGKSTIINILLGFLKHNSGEILIDNTILNESTINSWRQKVGYVSQDVFILDGSLQDNIAFGIPSNEVNLDKLNLAIEKSQLTEFVNSLPSGVSTNIGERGTKISGGQKQRIGIARALYKEAQILFFDEATSSLDSQTELEVNNAIKSLHDKDLTMVIIAHRESTLEYCDRIIELTN